MATIRPTAYPTIALVKAPAKEQGQNVSPAFGLQFFGHVAIDGATGEVIIGAVPLVPPRLNDDLQQVLEWVHREDVAVLVSDYEMPEITGAQLAGIVMDLLKKVAAVRRTAVATTRRPRCRSPRATSS